MFTHLLERARHDPAKAQQRLTALFKLLDPEQRVPLGAHYTDIQTIQKLIDPLITAPLTAEWEQTKAKMAKRKAFGAMKLYQGFLLRLSEFRVLDPACGSGNFLYLSLAALRDLEKRARVESMELGLPEQLTLATGPHNVLGIETNEFAAELARVTVWIGDIQWCRRNGYPHATKPILQPLDVIVGNPPFLGGNFTAWRRKRRRPTDLQRQVLLRDFPLPRRPDPRRHQPRHRNPGLRRHHPQGRTRPAGRGGSLRLDDR